MIPHAQKPGVCHQNHVSSLSRRKVTDFAILKGMIFPTYFLTPPKNHEIGKKSKNGVHFISSVFKVVRVKVLSVLLFFAYFILFWGGGQNVLIFFHNVFSKRVKKVMKQAKTNKNNSTFTLTTFKTVIIKCTPFFQFFTFSSFFSSVKMCLFFSKFSIIDGVLQSGFTDFFGPRTIFL